MEQIAFMVFHAQRLKTMNYGLWFAFRGNDVST